MLIQLTNGAGKMISRNPASFDSIDDVSDEKYPETKSVIRYADPKRFDYVRETQEEIWKLVNGR